MSCKGLENRQAAGRLPLADTFGICPPFMAGCLLVKPEDRQPYTMAGMDTMNRCAVQTKVIALFCMIILLGCATQQDVITLDDRLTAIERHNAQTEQKSLQIEARLDEYIKQDGRDLRQRTADQNVLMNTLREEIRTLNGRVEEIEYVVKHKIKSSEDSTGKRSDQLDGIEQMLRSNKGRIIRIEQYLNFEATEPALKPGQDSTTTSDLSTAKELSVDDIYKSAKQAFDQGDFEAARKGFQQLLQRYPKSESADNAQFWVGETYYREKWYEKAILEYQKVIEKYPKGNKVPASLFKQGLAFASLGDKANARLILTELVQKYPKSNEAKIASQQLKGLTP
ncbi:MAG: tol-pal system protein YbgF [Pseudomonadota bacterium]